MKSLCHALLEKEIDLDIGYLIFKEQKFKARFLFEQNETTKRIVVKIVDNHFCLIKSQYRKAFAFIKENLKWTDKQIEDEVNIREAFTNN